LREQARRKEVDLKAAAIAKKKPLATRNGRQNNPEHVLNTTSEIEPEIEALNAGMITNKTIRRKPRPPAIHMPVSHLS
jgi:hypothetical protein